jgi:hypothetical protein
LKNSGTGASADPVFSWTGTAAPWLSLSLGERWDFRASAGVKAEYDYQGDSWEIIPELYRLEASYRIRPELGITLGRIHFQDTLGLTAVGFFDGASFTAELGGLSLAAGGYYTGFLYKKSADILLSPGDLSNYNQPLDYGDPASYFASRRAIASLRGDLSGLFSERGVLSLEALGQFDLNDTADTLHSQYLLVQYRMNLPWNADFILGGTAGLGESAGEDPVISFAADLKGAWLPPTALQDRLLLGFRWGSGKINDRIRAFIPITAESPEGILEPPLAGLIIAQGAYEARLTRTLRAELLGRCFIRTDGETFSDPELSPGDSSPFLGGEALGKVSWAPFSDLYFNLSGGAFFPSEGAFQSGAAPRWKLSLETILTF